MQTIRTVLACLRNADQDYALIEDGDRIAIGVSGGKDSLCLLKALSIYGLFSHKRFKIVPVFLDLGFGNVDIEGVRNFVSSLGLELIVEDSTFVYPILKTHAKEGGHISCSICSRMKKAAINRVAKEKRCNKVAFAHHNDDAVETLLMNMIHGARIATFEPKMRLERAGITFIRPLIYCKESDLIRMAKEENLPVLKSACPADGHTMREESKEMLKHLYKEYPFSYKNFRTMLSNHESFHLYFQNLELTGENPSGYALKPVILAEDMRGLKAASRRAKKGEMVYRILHKEKPVGELAYALLFPHRIAIYGLDGDEEAQYHGIRILIELLSKKIVPATFVLYGGDPKARKRLGFQRIKEPAEKAPHWLVKTK